MSLEQTIQSLVAAVEANTAAMLSFSGAAVAAKAAAPAKTEAEPKAEAAPEKKAPTAAEKKAAAAAEKKAAEDAKKKSEITDEQISAMFGPLLAKSLEAAELASNKEFVATINTHFGVTKLRELTQEDRVLALQWGQERTDDADFEIPGAADEEDDGV